jgi:putative membrane protein
MLWLKTFHIVFMVTWFAGLFYLPRIFVYHSMADDPNVLDTFKVMERKLMVMTHIGGVLTWVFGLAILFALPLWITQGWMQVKLGFVILLTFYHFWCMGIVKALAKDQVNHGHVWYRWFNEFPTIILIFVVILVVFKPF